MRRPLIRLAIWSIAAVGAVVSTGVLTLGTERLIAASCHPPDPENLRASPAFRTMDGRDLRCCLEWEVTGRAGLASSGCCPASEYFWRLYHHDEHLERVEGLEIGDPSLLWWEAAYYDRAGRSPASEDCVTWMLTGSEGNAWGRCTPGERELVRIFYDRLLGVGRGEVSTPEPRDSIGPGDVEGLDS